MPADGYESKIDAVVTEPPRLLGDGDHLGSTLTIAPSILEMDRAVAMMTSGHVLRRPALLVNVPSLADPTIAPEGRHVLSIEVLLTPYRHPGGWAGSAEPQRWLEVFAGRCEPGFLETIVDWRAVTPDVYEREFHLPAGHAASFGGGPLAAFRTRDPELTRYETAVPGLYLTGAATFPGAGIWGASGRNCATVVLARTSAGSLASRTGMLTGSISLGRLAGAALRVHWSAIVIAALLAAVLSEGLGFLGAGLVVVAFFVSIFLHELAHAVVARRFDVSTTAIELWALGGMARLDHEPRSARAEGWIAAAGPLASLAPRWRRRRAPRSVSVRSARRTRVVEVVAGLGVLNAALGVFNLLPGAPLDGGRIVKAVRWAQHGNRYRAMREAGIAGRVLGWALGGLGFGLLIYGEPGLWLALTGMFIAVNARAEIALADLGERLDGVKVGDLTWFGVAETDAEMDADSMIWQRSRLGGAGAVAVRGDNGELDGLVLEDQLWAVPVEQRPWVMLTSLMMPFNRLAQADPDDELASVLPKLNPLRPVVTVWRDGHLLGVIPPAILRQKLAPRPSI